MRQDVPGGFLVEFPTGLSIVYFGFFGEVLVTLFIGRPHVGTQPLSVLL
jgi:hypothetical protein